MQLVYLPDIYGRQGVRINESNEGRTRMTPLYEQPMRKLLGVLSPTISWLDEKGSVEVGDVPVDHQDAIKQLERIGIVHKRNNRCYELQKIRLKKLMGTLGIETLAPPHIADPIVHSELN